MYKKNHMQKLKRIANASRLGSAHHGIILSIHISFFHWYHWYHWYEIWLVNQSRNIWSCSAIPRTCTPILKYIIIYLFHCAWDDYSRYQSESILAHDDWGKYISCTIKAAFPFWSVRLSLWKRWSVEVFWSVPKVERASSLPNLAMCFSASACQPSTGRGMKLMKLWWFFRGKLTFVPLWYSKPKN